MRDPEWVSLSDAERGQLVAMWLLAADHDGVIPASPELIQKICFMETPPNLKKFTDLKFIDANPTPTRRQHDQPKAETEKSREDILSGCEKVLNYLREETERNWKVSGDLQQRLKGKTTVNDCLRVIDVKLKQDFFRKNNFENMKPSTLFRKKNFERYLEEVSEVLNDR